MTVRLAIKLLVKTGANRFPAVGAGDQTALAKTLATGLTRADFGAVLFTTGATNCATSADQACLALLGMDMIDPEVATTLAYTTNCTFCLTAVADRITTSRATADVLLTCPFTASPTELTTSVTVCRPTDRAGLYAARRTENVLAGAALFDTIITGDVSIAVNGNSRSGLSTGVATWATQFTTVAIALDRDHDFLFAVTECHLRFCDRHQKNRIVDKL